MAERKGQRERQARVSVRPRSGTASRARPKPLPADELTRLRAELEAARQEIAELRALQDEVLNRIDWVIDSLNSLGE